MFHLLAFQGSVAQNASLANIPLITDTYFTQTTDGYYPPATFKALIGYARIDSGSQARLNTPLLRIPVYPYFSNLDLASDPPNLPPVNEWYDNGPQVVQNDPLNVTVSRAGSGAATCEALVWMAKSTPARVMGQVRTIRATSAITRVANGWSEGPLTLQDQLPTGTYNIVGLASFGTNLLASRFVFPDQPMRPGTLAQQAVGEYSWDRFRFGNMGVFGQFRSTAVPTVQIMGYGANTSQTHLIDVIQVG